MSTTSSQPTSKQSTSQPSPTLRDIVAALEKYGRTEEAGEYILYATTYLEFVHGITEADALDMDIEAVIQLLKLPMKPLKYDGWNFRWGKAAVEGRR